MLDRGLSLVRSPVQLGEPEVAAADQGSHAEVHRQTDRPTIRVFGRLDLWQITPGRRFTEQPQRPGFPPALLVLDRESETAARLEWAWSGDQFVDPAGRPAR